MIRISLGLRSFNAITYNSNFQTPTVPINFSYLRIKKSFQEKKKEKKSYLIEKNIYINTRKKENFEMRWKKTIATKVRRIDFNKSIANCENRSKSSSKWCPRYSLRRFLNNFRGKVNIFFGGCAYLDPPRAPNRVLSRPSSNGLVWRERDNEKRKISCNSFVIRWRQYLVEKIIQKFIRNVYLKLII